MKFSTSLLSSLAGGLLSFLLFLFQKDKDSVRLYKWQHCCLSQAKLVKPIVACELGRLYNKEAIIEKLLNDKSEGSNANSDGTADHIKSLKVIVILNVIQSSLFGAA